MRTRIILSLSVFAFAIIALVTSNPTETSVFAATTPTPKVTNSADSEIERERQLVKELSLNIPEQTDDPTYPVTYIDPSKQGVDITVDDKTTAKAPNPFLLPNLAMGEHTITFRFKNKDGLVRILVKKVVIIPKAPLFDSTIKTAVVKPASMVLSGTALPQASLLIIINSSKSYTVTVSPEGKWEFIVPDPIIGQNNIMAFTVRNGIVSIPSKVLTISYTLTNTSVTTTGATEKQNPVLGFIKSFINNIDANRRENPAIFYGIIALAFIVIVTLLQLTYKKKAAKKRDEKTIAALFGTLQKDGGTIIDAIKSVSNIKSKPTEQPESVEPELPKASPKVKKALEELKEELSEGEEETVSSNETTTATVVEEPVKSKKKKKKSTAKEVTQVVETLPAQNVSDSAAVEDNKVVENTLSTPEEKPKERKSLLSFFSKKSTDQNVPTKPKEEKQEVQDIPATSEQVTEQEAPVENDIELEEEPEKKVLTKEEFLKQFQKKAEED